MKHVSREGPVHLAILHWLRLVMPGAVIHHSAQGVDMAGADVARAIAKARHMGMLPGFPDLLCIYGGVTIGFEVKAEGGTLQPSQRDVGAAFVANGARWAVVRSIDDCREYLAEWGVRTRETGL